MEKVTQDDFFNRYKYNVKTDILGGGSFGKVYKSDDDTLNSVVAIKVSEVKTIGDKVFSLIDEFNAIKDLPVHRNIANYQYMHTFEMSNGIFDFAIMQYYPDGNLAQFLKGDVSLDRKEQIAIDLLYGVIHLHNNDIVLRDLKPSNILLVIRPNEVIPKITDFGLSKKTNSNDQSKIDNSFGGGTLAYSSPEQLMGDDLRHNTDLWAFGVILYEIFNQKPLFSTKSTSSVNNDLDIIDQVKGKNLESFFGEVPDKWQEVLRICLDRDANKRVKSGKIILDLLNKAQTTKKPEINLDEESIVYTSKDRQAFKKVDKGSNSQEKGKNDGNTNNSLGPKIKSKNVAIITLLSLLCFILIYLGYNSTTEKTKVQEVNTVLSNSSGLNKIEPVIVDEMINDNPEKNTTVKSNEEKVWVKTLKNNTIDSFKKFNENYPSSKHLPKSKSKIKLLSITRQEKKKEDEKNKMELDTWNKAVKQNTIKAYKYYLGQYPKGKYLSMSIENISKLEEGIKWVELGKTIKKAELLASEKKYSSAIALLENIPKKSESKQKIENTIAYYTRLGTNAAAPISTKIVKTRKSGKDQCSPEMQKLYREYLKYKTNPSYEKKLKECP